jgi:DNA-binding transcriptional MerR regulator
LENPIAEKQEKRRETWRAKARRLGVSPKTLDRWVTKGIISPPSYVNGRKYGDADEEPRLDAAE